MFSRRHHLLRDVLIFTAPFVVFICYVLGSAFASYYNAEIKNFSGYKTRSLRVGSMQAMLDFSSQPILTPVKHRYLESNVDLHDGLRIFDLRVDGNKLEQLDEAMPGSGKEWVDAVLKESGGFQDVEARYRGQRMENFFWSERAWKIKTDKVELVEGYRTINLTKLEGRLDNHLTFQVGAHLGLPTPQSRIVRLFLNMRDQGVYLQEEQIDESMIRRTGRMPGDVFYGEIFVPDEPKLSTDDLFCNPYIWEKKEKNNKYDEEYRPHLTRMLDLVSSEAEQSWDELYDLFSYDGLVRHMAVTTFQGDQHVDHSHNHKLYFSPLTGHFEPILWNVRLNMPRGYGMESMANRLFEKLARDPRFLDDVHAVVWAELLQPNYSAKLVEEIERIRDDSAQFALNFAEFDRYLSNMAEIVEARRRTLFNAHRGSELHFTTSTTDGPVLGLDLRAKGLMSFRLRALQFDGAVDGLEVFEDRDFDGKITAADRRLQVAVQKHRLEVTDGDALVFTGRDFSAPYRVTTEPVKEAFQVHRQYTRLAFLNNPYLIRASSGNVPKVIDVQVEPVIGNHPIAVSEGLVAETGTVKTVHPWRHAPASAPIEYRFESDTELTEDLIVRAEDRLFITPGVTLKLDAGVSVIVHRQVELEDLSVMRLDETKPWGVFALQGPGTSGSVLRNCRFEGGSHDTIEFVDYLGMVSVHEADSVQFLGGSAARNVFGDDTVRFARCSNFLVDEFTVHHANGDAIDCDISTGEIRNSSVQKPQNDGIDLMTANVNLTNVIIHGAGDKGVSLGENANPEIRNCQIIECNIGLAMKDGSDPVVSQSSILRCQTGVAGYDKNWRYPGGGRGTLVDCELVDNEVDVKLDENSSLTLEKCKTGGKYVFPESYDKLQFLELNSRNPSQ